MKNSPVESNLTCERSPLGGFLNFIDSKFFFKKSTFILLRGHDVLSAVGIQGGGSNIHYRLALVSAKVQMPKWRMEVLPRKFQNRCSSFFYFSALYGIELGDKGKGTRDSPPGARICYCT